MLPLGPPAEMTTDLVGVGLGEVPPAKNKTPFEVEVGELAPTVIYTDPPAPQLAEPEPIYNAPLFPTLDVPVLNTNKPLTPLFPAFEVPTTNAPLENAEP